MYTHLKIRGHKGIKEILIENCGKINVICGINDSGKTSILEGIADPQKRHVGAELPRQVLENISKEIPAYLHPNFSQYKHTLDDIWKQRFIALIESGGLVFYSDEHQKLANTITAAFIRSLQERQRYFQNHSSDSLVHVPRNDVIQRIIAEFLGRTEDVLLIPASRRIHTKGNTNSFTSNQRPPVEFNGAGILETLYIGQNKKPSDSERKTFESIRRAFQEVTGGYTFGIFMEGNNTFELHFSKTELDHIGADSRGFGLQEVLIILFFVVSGKSKILLIDEPENHIHPDFQRRLLDYMYRSEKQYFITTHSNVFLNRIYVDRIYFSWFGEEVNVSDVSSKSSILGSLGYSVSDNLVSDLIVLVEGPSDTPVIQEFLLKMGLLGKYSIKFWALGGNIMDKADLSVFAQDRKLTALVDQDPESDSTRKAFLKKCKELKIPCKRLNRYSIENYFTVSAIKSVFKDKDLVALSVVKPDVKLAHQLKFNPKSRNLEVARAMKLEDIAGTDLEDFLKDIKKILER